MREEERKKERKNVKVKANLMDNEVREQKIKTEITQSYCD